MIERDEKQLLLKELFVADATTRRTAPLLCDQWQYFVMMYDIEKGGTPPAKSYLRINAKYIDHDGVEYAITDPKFGCVLEEVSFVPAKRAIEGRCLGKELVFEVVSSGALSTLNYYTCRLYVQFYRDVPAVRG